MKEEDGGARREEATSNSTQNTYRSAKAANHGTQNSGCSVLVSASFVSKFAEVKLQSRSQEIIAYFLVRDAVSTREGRRHVEDSPLQTRL